jgi:sugar lactone lactonase YvrE
VTQFQKPSWIENIAVRSNGDLLLTQLFPSPILYTVISPASASPKTGIVHIFDGVEGLLGITETTTADVFVLVGTNASNPGSGASTAWSVDFRQRDSQPAVTEIAQLRDARVPNGMTTSPQLGDSVLIADSAGFVWHLDLHTGEHRVAAQVPEMAPAAGSSGTGINGVKMHGGYLYWSNSADASLYRLGVRRDGSPCESARVQKAAAPDATFLDDFVIGKDGTIWAATNSDNRLLAVRGFNGSVVVAGGTSELTLAGNTAAAFGRGKTDAHILYVVTCGGLRAPVNGTYTEGGKVVAVDTRGFAWD